MITRGGIDTATPAGTALSRLFDAIDLFRQLGPAGADPCVVADLVRRFIAEPPMEIDEQRALELKAMEYADYLQTPEWSAQRQRALSAAEFACQGCDSAARLHVHHRTYANLPRERPVDLTVLCADCHEAVHGVIDARRRRGSS